LFELRSLAHLLLVHHEWWLDLLVPMFSKEIKAVRDERLVQIDPVICQKIASTANDFSTYTNM